MIIGPSIAGRRLRHFSARQLHHILKQSGTNITTPFDSPVHVVHRNPSLSLRSTNSRHFHPPK